MLDALVWRYELGARLCDECDVTHALTSAPAQRGDVNLLRHSRDQRREATHLCGGAWLAAISGRSQLDLGAISVGSLVRYLCAPRRWSGRAETSRTLRRPPPSTACARHARMSASRCWRPVASASASAATRAYHRRSDAAQAQAMPLRRSQPRRPRSCPLTRPRHQRDVRSRGAGARRYLPCLDSRRDRVPSAH